MKKALWAAALALAAVSSFATPAGAAVGDCREVLDYTDPEFPAPTGVDVCREDAWFHAGDQRLGNVSSTPSWDTTKPADAFPTGGAVYGTARIVDIADEGNTNAVPTFTGTYTGTLDNIALTAYATSLYTAVGGPNPLIMRLVIDDEMVFNNGGVDDADLGVANNTVDEHTSSMSFAFTNLANALAGVGVANGPTTKHTIKVSFVNKYWGDSNFLMSYDSAEYPSGLIFNMETNPEDGSLSGYTEVPTGV